MLHLVAQTRNVGVTAETQQEHRGGGGQVVRGVRPQVVCVVLLREGADTQTEGGDHEHHNAT